MAQSGQSSSKAKMEVECKVINQLPSYHIPHLSSIILSDAEGATPFSRMLIFKISQILAYSFLPPTFSNHPSNNTLP